MLGMVGSPLPRLLMHVHFPSHVCFSIAASLSPKSSTHYSKSVMEENDLPAKCCMCKAEIASNVFEMNLSAEYREQYIMFNAVRTIGKDESILTCPSCSWFSIGFAEPPLFLKCQGQCKALSCFNCKATLPDPVQNAEQERQRDKHIVHGDPELFKWYKKWMGAEDACKVFCPNADCEVSGGIKDDACLHMTCNGCRTEYCYFCRLPVEEVNQATDAELAFHGNPNLSPIYRHNVNWVNNPSRCPMYLTQIHEQDYR